MSEWMGLVGNYGVPTVAAGLVLWVFRRLVLRLERENESLLARVLHGNGEEDEPSIRRLEERLDGIGAKLAEAEATQTKVSRELRGALGEIRETLDRLPCRLGAACTGGG